MNKKLPYEDAFERQMNDLPAPNEDESWQKMTELLDDNKRKRPFIFFRNPKVWGTLVLVLLAGLWLVIHSSNSPKEKGFTAGQNKTNIKQKAASHNLPETDNGAHKPKAITADDQLKKSKINTTVTDQSTVGASPERTIRTQKVNRGATKLSEASTAETSVKSSIARQNNLPAGRQSTRLKKNGAIVKEYLGAAKDSPGYVAKLPANELLSNIPGNTNSTVQPGNNDTLTHPDTTIRKDDIAVSDSAESKKIASNKAKKYVISAGLGVQQQIPVGGQQVVHYGHNANNSTLTDYIPSIYFRFQRNEKWFLQTGFSYGSPQLVKEFAYNRQTLADTSSSFTTTTLRLKKTYYSEVLLSFNYYIRPNWTAGIGGMYSWFHGAITEKEILTSNAATQTQTIAKEIIPIRGYNDSFLYRSHTYLLLQTDYNWRRFSAGLRYSRDLQPYIKYTLPDGTVTRQRNWSLEFILRLRLWNSAKF